MTKEEWIEVQVKEHEERLGAPLPAHNKGVLRAMLGKIHDFWEEEEARTLNDNNRYHDDN